MRAAWGEFPDIFELQSCMDPSTPQNDSQSESFCSVQDDSGESGGAKGQKSKAPVVIRGWILPVGTPSIKLDYNKARLRSCRVVVRRTTHSTPSGFASVSQGRLLNRNG